MHSHFIIDDCPSGARRWRLPRALFRSVALLLLWSPSANAKKGEDQFVLAPPAEVIGSPPFWSSHEDFPAYALGHGEQGTVGIVLSVDTKGHVYRCKVVASSGSPSLDSVTCANARTRARFNPVHDEQRQPIYGSYSFYTTWMNPNVQVNFATVFDRLDVVLAVNQLPPNASPVMWIRQIVEADGKISACYAEGQRIDQSLARVACRFLGTQQVTPVSDAENVPVRAIVALRVGFRTGSP